MKVGDHRCPNCDTTMGTMREIQVGDRKDQKMYTLCIVCHSFLEVLEMKEGKVKVKALSQEEIAEMPDLDRITLQRVARKMDGFPPEMLKKSLERHTELTEKWEKARMGVLDRINSLIEASTDPSVGVVIILADLKNKIGWQVMENNIPDEILGNVLYKSLMVAEGGAKKMMEDILSGKD